MIHNFLYVMSGNGHDIPWKKVKVTGNQDISLDELANARLSLVVYLECQRIRAQLMRCLVHSNYVDGYDF